MTLGSRRTRCGVVVGGRPAEAGGFQGLGLVRVHGRSSRRTPIAAPQRRHTSATMSAWRRRWPAARLATPHGRNARGPHLPACALRRGRSIGPLPQRLSSFSMAPVRANTLDSRSWQAPKEPDDCRAELAGFGERQHVRPGRQRHRRRGSLSCASGASRAEDALHEVVDPVLRRDAVVGPPDDEDGTGHCPEDLYDVVTPGGVHRSENVGHTGAVVLPYEAGHLPGSLVAGGGEPALHQGAPGDRPEVGRRT